MPWKNHLIRVIDRSYLIIIIISYVVRVYLEGEMFEEVRRSICLVRLCSTSSVNPYADGRSLRPGRMLSCNLSFGKMTYQNINIYQISRMIIVTVRPFDNVVLSVLTPS